MKIRFVLFGIATAFFLIIWPSFSLFLEVPYNDKRLAQGFLLILGTGLVCSSLFIQKQWLGIAKKFNERTIPFTTVIGLVFGIGVLSSVLANYPTAALLQVGHYFLLFNFALLAAVTYRYNSNYFEFGLLSVIGCMAAIYLINVAISYGYVFFVPDFPLWPSIDFTRIWLKEGGFMYPEPFSNFVNVRFFNHLQTWTLPLMSLLVVYIPKRYWALSKIAFIVLCGWWMLVFASDARGTLIASILSFGVLFFLYRKKAAKWMRVHGLSAVSGLALYGLFFKVFPLLVATTSSRTAFSRHTPGKRFEFLENAANTIIQNPLLGIGPMHFSDWADMFSKHPHNIYMQFLGEWGLLSGMLCLIVIVVGGYYWSVQSHNVIRNSPKNSNKINVRITLTASLLAALVHGLVSGIINTPLSQMMMVLVIGWMIGISYPHISEKEFDSTGLWRKLGVIMINALAAGFLIWCYISEVPDLKENRHKYIQVTKENRLFPRYWDQGVIGLPEKEGQENK